MNCRTHCRAGVIALYRQQILVAFGEVENNLAAIRYLADQAAAQ
jgi:outer membrane protein TolC